MYPVVPKLEHTEFEPSLPVVPTLEVANGLPGVATQKDDATDNGGRKKRGISRGPSNEAMAGVLMFVDTDGEVCINNAGQQFSTLRIAWRR